MIMEERRPMHRPALGQANVWTPQGSVKESLPYFKSFINSVYGDSVFKQVNHMYT